MRLRRRRTPPWARADWRSFHSPRPPLGAEPAQRGRRRPPREVPAGETRRRVLAAGAAALLLAALVALLLAPAFRIRHVEVSGERHLKAAEVVRLAGLERPGPLLLFDSRSTRQRLEASTWIRSATVSSRLPGEVTLRVDEWSPVAVYRAGGATPWYLSDQAVALGPVSGGGGAGLVEIDGPAKPQPKQGARPLDTQLLVALVNIQRALPGLIAQPVRSFQLDACGNLTMTAGRGWKVQFGRVLTPEEFTSLRDKVAALRSIQPYVDYNSPGLVYVNVMNPTQPAVQDGSVKPSPTPKPVSGGRPAASPGPAPVAVGPAPVVVAPSCR